MPKVCTERGQAMTLLVLEYHRARPNPRLLNNLVKQNSDLVHSIARRISQTCPQELEDLEQYGFIGLLKAIENFDPTRGYAFSSYAEPKIRGEMLHYRDRSEDPHLGFHRSQSGMAKWFNVRNRAKLWRERGLTATDEQVAWSFRIPPDEWAHIAKERTRQNPIALDNSDEAPQLEAPSTDGHDSIREALQRLPTAQCYAVSRHCMDDAELGTIAAEMGKEIDEVARLIELGKRKLCATAANF